MDTAGPLESDLRLQKYTIDGVSPIQPTFLKQRRLCI